MRRSFLRPLVLTAAAALALAACSPASESGETSAESTTAGAGGSGDQSVVTFRLWDEVAVPAYEDSFAAFTEQNPDIAVEIELVPWASYWERLPLDVSSGDMADIFWTNTSNFSLYADNGTLLNIDEVLGEDHDEWQPAVVDLYTRGGVNYGVPQLWDSIGLFYNAELVEAAGVDVSDLQWRPEAAEGDTLLAAATALTTDSEGRHPDEDGFDPNQRETFGFNSQVDLQAIYVNFLAENGALFQDPETDAFVFATPEGEQAFQYLVDLVNEYHVAPSAADTNTNGDYSRDLFVQGDLGLFQSGPYSLRHIADNAQFEWGLAPMVAGSQGRIGVVHGVAAVGNAETENLAATTEVLRWLGSAEGQTPLATQGVAFPGAVEAEQAFVDYWAAEGVDISVFLESAQDPTAPSPTGTQVNAGANVITPIFQDMFLGSVPVPEALARAQSEGNEAMGIAE